MDTNKFLIMNFGFFLNYQVLPSGLLNIAYPISGIMQAALLHKYEASLQRL